MSVVKRNILVIGVAALSIQTCYGQFGVAAGAGVDQWNRQRELNLQQQQIDLQRQQIELQRQQQEYDAELFKREQMVRQLQAYQREKERQDFEDKQRRRATAEAQLCDEQKKILREFDTERGAEGVVVANRARQVALEQWKNGCVLGLTTAQFKETLEGLLQRIIEDKISNFISSKKEYNNQKNADAFMNELSEVIAATKRGELSQLDSVDEKLEFAHRRALKRIAANKQLTAPKKNI